jgi:DNA polymerase-4
MGPEEPESVTAGHPALGRERVVLHVDMDCFYVSVERLLNPALNGLPVAVGGRSGRSVISSASYEARPFGVRSAMPVGEALRLCPQLVIVEGSMAHYSEYSERLEKIFERFAPVVQMASQDEAYLDLTGTERLYGTPLVAAEKLRHAVLAETNLPCSIGIARNKMVAKVASDLCKPKGLLWVLPGSEALLLAPLAIERLPGIGKKTAQRLHELGVRRLGELAGFDPELLRAHFGSHGPEMRERARGHAEGEVERGTIAKSIGAEQTLGEDSVDATRLDGILSALAERVASRLRGEGLRAGQVTLKYRYDDFETHTAGRTLAHGTDDDLQLLRIARELLAEKWNRSRRIRLLGLSAHQLDSGDEQMDLLAAPEESGAQKLHAAIDRIRIRHGFGGIHRGSSEGRLS